VPDTILGETLKSKRRASGIPAAVLARKICVSTTRLSALERGYITVSSAEMRRIMAALDQLIVAKQEIVRVALEFGWPSEAEVTLP
jgi:transcriptional regulator with XRE-family HTH domain